VCRTGWAPVGDRAAPQVGPFGPAPRRRGLRTW